MATVILEDDNIRVNVSVGKTLRQVATKVGASMEFGCRVGDCATCVARIVSGMEFLSEKSVKELKTLKMLEGDVDQLRLMCQCDVATEEGEIVISYTP